MLHRKILIGKYRLRIKQAPLQIMQIKGRMLSILHGQGRISSAIDAKAKDTLLLNAQVQRIFIMPTMKTMPTNRSMLMKSMELKPHMQSRKFHPSKEIIHSIKLKKKERYSFVAFSSLLKGEAEDWRRTSIFRFMAKCRNRLCYLVIDGESEMNVVSQDVVDKLMLPTEKHPTPYKVSWVNEAAILVTKWCRVTFKIGGYEDSIWCGIIPMNVTHILL
eukprot:TRINITY_DN27599_c0_g1_i4.p1 TRINITY_DN27599_c0_g1~~TRINITY_DN27599_c0_g1_i4.p1  ORF type:complete len:218 (+),score=15.85 TRINITY_DN27599_c0_g1_i4:232-885(+)